VPISFHGLVLSRLSDEHSGKRRAPCAAPRRSFCLAIVLCHLFAPLAILSVPMKLLAQAEDVRLSEARWRMVKEEVVGAGIRDPRVVVAIRNTPRHHFVLPAYRQQAYLDIALPIGEGQTISPPFVVAYMTQELRPEPEDKVLEIGTGSGYQAAVLSPLVADVYSIEIVEPLGKRAAETLERLGYTNVHTRVGDGFQGWPEHAPFDKIIVTCSPENVPQALFEQLREGGTMVIPLGERYQQQLYRLTKRNGQLEREILEPTFFVPMTGQAEQLREVKSDTGRPELINGSFEAVSDDGLPLGWYYVRQATILEDAAARDGQRLLELKNETPGRGAQLLQALAMDGRLVKEIDLTLWIETKQVRAGQDASQVPRVDLYYFNEQRIPIGSVTLGPWRGQVTWSQQRARAKVPPDARLAVLAVGMFGATGQVRVDHISIRSLP
jgi:protein-L-isoaspartate(D-aspartate) O-methyltransferase